MKYDYLIIGQGIAGTVLAHQLLRRRKKILILDSPSLSQSSRISAGLFNPIVFKRIVKSWKVDTLLPEALGFYKDIETTLNQNLIYKKNILKIFIGEDEKELWKKKLQDLSFYLSAINSADSISNFLHPNAGTAEVVHAGHLNVSDFIILSREFFLNQGCLDEDIFDYAKIKINPENIEYKGISTDKIIFCEGFKALDNPYFNYLKFKLTKGELLTVKIRNFPEEKIINKGVFILPLGNNLFRVGATYEWATINEERSQTGKNELIEKFEKVINVPYEVIGHDAGVRPTVIDRRPLLGIHPNFKSLAIFNGMGTKGVMLAPFFAKQMCNYLEHNLPLDPEVDINRFSTIAI